ncbi:hypothetical protein [Bizionia paragorgiae]|uniref:Uncharacterized protein n=1 Tax=Bizionia paragorgiae TaxID=283786 RepID=A0A1H3WWQ8_BIZPA|nr:hypothetical protein [Bizionia paragorgiae]SDZ91585.1 hypothetical protein SAMN04487990_10441 [Bizionia paragorgiae]
MTRIDKKKYILPGIFAGLVYAGVMAAFDYNDDVPFSIFKFLIHFFLFGLFMAGINYYSLRKAGKKKE